jgi:hypothetical protein
MADDRPLAPGVNSMSSDEEATVGERVLLSFSLGVGWRGPPGGARG